jgi:PleD family two-component response regulator
MNVSESDILNSRILIVDDQAANVSLLEQVLADAGYTRVTSTLDPHQAVPLHRENQYDLILLENRRARAFP